METIDIDKTALTDLIIKALSNGYVNNGWCIIVDLQGELSLFPNDSCRPYTNHIKVVDLDTIEDIYIEQVGIDYQEAAKQVVASLEWYPFAFDSDMMTAVRLNLI